MRPSLPAANAGAAAALVATAHTLVNLRRLRVPPPAAPVDELVSVLLPMRDEAARIEPCLRALLASRGIPRLEIFLVDDSSADGTAGVVTALAGADERVHLLAGEPLPAGWLGKSHACHQAVGRAGGSVLVFLDADVVLAPDGLARAVAALEGLDLVCPYPRQQAVTAGERLVQPLLQWSWLTFLPLRLAERSPRPALAAANGQLLVVRRAAYDRAGGHAAVRADVLEDLALARAVKKTGGRAGMADGTELASCRMYGSWAELRDGYAKSLWTAFGPPAGAAVTMALLAWLYLLPPVALLRTYQPRSPTHPTSHQPSRPLLLAATAAGVVGRAAVAARVGGRVWPDSALHPGSLLTLGWLTALSFVRHRRGRTTWKGRPL